MSAYRRGKSNFPVQNLAVFSWMGLCWSFQWQLQAPICVSAVCQEPGCPLMSQLLTTRLHVFISFSFQDYTCPICESGFIEELSEERRYGGFFRLHSFSFLCVEVRFWVLNVSVQYRKWVCVHIVHPWPEPPGPRGNLLKSLDVENVSLPPPLSNIAAVVSPRTWITSISWRFPPGTAPLPLESLMKVSTLERGCPLRTTEKRKTGESGKWLRGKDTVQGSHGVGTFLDDRVHATKECPR